jgi:hypothetical protein
MLRKTYVGTYHINKLAQKRNTYMYIIFFSASRCISCSSSMGDLRTHALNNAHAQRVSELLANYME